MESVYTNPIYKKHLSQRNNQQTIMLGFSDGTKDGGYLMANWSILKAKEALTSISRKYGIKVILYPILNKKVFLTSYNTTNNEQQ